MPKIYIKPAPGRQVRIPHTNEHLPATGAHVDDSPYWRRRLALGDVLEASAPKVEASLRLVDRLAELADGVLEGARSGSTEDAQLALEQFRADSGPLFAEAEAEAAGMTPEEQDQVAAHYAGAVAPKVEELEAIASGEHAKPRRGSRRARK